MKLLELFSGTGSVGAVARNMGHSVVSLDFKNADINCDILNWDYKKYEVKHFDFIWASPPCTEYSKAKTTGIYEAKKIVLKTIEIIFKKSAAILGGRKSSSRAFEEATFIEGVQI